jgi:hypothetical protein
VIPYWPIINTQIKALV